MDIHQAMYFVGTKQTPAKNEVLAKEFARLIKESVPQFK